MRSAALVAGAVLVATVTSAQVPRVGNARVQQAAVSGAFDSFFEGLVRQQSGAAWIGYAVAAVPGHHAGCWGTGDSSAVNSPAYLEGRPAGVGTEQHPVKLEGDSSLLVLLRVENQQVGKVVILSPECEIDAGGLPFISLAGVVPADSVRMLSGLARREGTSDRVVRAALTALALHNDPAADAALEQFVGAGQGMAIRKQAAFWLGTARGERGYQILRAAVERDTNAGFRKEATFGLAQSPVPAAIDTLVRMAKSDADASVRGQALFWIAQKAGKRAAPAITEAIASDPDAQVKERAVFALSQLPKEEGVPLLIQVARENRDARVRQRAMFWLGQSKDPRALAFFEEVLKAR